MAEEEPVLAEEMSETSEMAVVDPADIPKTEINILILGETGVGKSTFINGFVNYLTFDTLDDAKNSPELISLIESSFVITDPDTMVERTIKTGNATNEDLTVGQSATQASRVYCFNIGQHVIRIIDTPGIGDVRGIGKDEENFQNILDTISNYDHLNGILILLKPNDARLGVMFRFCVTELLTHLHRSAVENIVFGFTNTRSTFYAPGETLPALRKLLNANPDVKIQLSRETVYNFDSESFRFLAAFKDGTNFDKKTCNAFMESWDHSVKETRRLVEHILQTKPHAIHETTSLNSVRNLIIKLTKPLAEVTRLIDFNRKVCDDKIIELQTTKNYGKKLGKQLMIQKIDLVGRELGQPRTVCTNAACIEVRDWEGMKKINYKTHCHNRCTRQNVQIDTVNSAALINCWAMDKTTNKCRICGHGFQEHMHVVHEYIPVTKMVVDKNIESQINKSTSDADKKKIAIEELKKRRQEYQDEQMQVEKTAAKYGCFLKHNAILPYSDARIEYLDHLIKEERAKAQVSGDDSIVDALQLTKQRYLEEMRIIDKSIKDGKSSKVLDLSLIAAEEYKLYRLKHFGKTLQQVRNVGSAAHKLLKREIAFQAPERCLFMSYVWNSYMRNAVHPEITFQASERFSFISYISESLEDLF